MDINGMFNKKPKNNITSSQVTEERILSLRKANIKNKFLSSKKKEFELSNNPCEKSYKIIIEQLNLSDEKTKEFVDLFYKEQSHYNQISMVLSMIKHPDCTQALKEFCIKQIGNWTQLLTTDQSPEISIIQSLFTPEVIETIMSILFQQNQTNQIIYEICNIFIYLTFSKSVSSIYSNIFAQYITTFYQFLSAQNDQIILKQLLWIFAHILCESDEMKEQVTSQCSIIEYICAIIENHNKNLMSLNAMAFWIFSNLIKGKDCIYLLEKKCIIIIPIIGKYIRTQLDHNVFSEALRAIKRFLGLFHGKNMRNTAMINMIRSLDLSRHLAPFLSLKNTMIHNKIRIVKIFISLSKLSDNFLEDISQEKIIGAIEDIITKIKNNELKKKTIIERKTMFFMKVLEFLLILSSEDIPVYIKKTIVRKTNICKELIALKRIMNNITIENEIIIILYNFLESDSKTIITHMIVIELPELFCDSLEDSLSNDNIIYSLKGILIMIEYGTNLIKISNMMAIFFEQINCPAKVEKLLNHSNESIAILASDLLNKHFNKPNINN